MDRAVAEKPPELEITAVDIADCVSEHCGLVSARLRAPVRGFHQVEHPWDGHVEHLGGIAKPGPSADFGKLIAEETGKWEKAIKAGGAALE
jgi:hypothetical protein